MQQGLLVEFPVEVDWKIWDQGVVPVLEDPRWSLSEPVNSSISINNTSEFVSLLEKSLVVSFKSAGFIPESFNP